MDSEEYYIIVVGDGKDKSGKTTDLSSFSDETIKLFIKEHFRKKPHLNKEEPLDIEIKQENEEERSEIQIETPAELLECPVCFSKIKSNYYRRHIRRQHGDKKKEMIAPPKVFKECPVCYKNVVSTYLRRHLIRKHKSYAKQELFRQQELLNRVKNPKAKAYSNKLQKCPICKKEVKLLSQHIRRQHERDKLRGKREMLCCACNICSAKRRDSKANSKCGCHICATYMRQFGREAFKKNKDSKTFSCDMCTASFSAKVALQAHLNAHLGQRPFKCPDCPFAYTRKSSLLQHRKKHSNDEYICDYCNKVFKRRDSLIEHLKCHSTTKYQCRLCKKIYAFSSSLRKHIQSAHTNPEGHKCHKCTKSFKEFYVLRKHMMKEHNFNLVTKRVFYNMLPKMDLFIESQKF